MQYLYRVKRGVQTKLVNDKIKSKKELKTWELVGTVGKKEKKGDDKPEDNK